MKTKHNYQVPSVKVVSFKVEGGFLPSQTPETTEAYVGDETTETTGTQDFGFGSIYSN